MLKGTSLFYACYGIIEMMVPMPRMMMLMVVPRMMMEDNNDDDDGKEDNFDGQAAAV